MTHSFLEQNGNGLTMNGIGRTPPKENGLDLGMNNHKNKDPVSPHSGTSSNSSTPAPHGAVPVPKKSSEAVDTNGKPSTPKSARSTPPGPGSDGPPLKPGLPGPLYGIGYPPGPPPPGSNHPPTPTNGHGASDSYRFNDSLRAPPIGIPPGGKP